MKYSIFTCFFLFSLNLISQVYPTLKIKYESIDEYYQDSSGETIFGQLVFCNQESTYTETHKIINPNTIFIDENDKITGDYIEEKKVLYKNFNKNYLLTHSGIAYVKKALLKDSLNIFQWQIINKEKTILGYTCKAASSNFRGRNYTAYYVPEIAVSDGPWKFNGLPGLILEVTDEKNRIQYEAVEIIVENTLTEITSPFNENKAMYWDDVIAKAKKKFRATQNEIESKYNSKTTVTFNGIEIYDLNE
ncbi:GLPGLI family protein [Rasiella sp. SM2506]|uniref:GLPGLI family protein n=1 Tax=Rasiella sp. SM2506 TaxID=3423914 RepID=UPI003D79FACB